MRKMYLAVIIREFDENPSVCPEGVEKMILHEGGRKRADLDKPITVQYIMNSIGVDHGFYSTSIPVDGITKERQEWGLELGVVFARRITRVLPQFGYEPAVLEDCAAAVDDFLAGTKDYEEVQMHRRAILKFMQDRGLKDRTPVKAACRAMWHASGRNPEDLYWAARYSRKAVAYKYPKTGPSNPLNKSFSNIIEEEEAETQKELLFERLL